MLTLPHAWSLRPRLLRQPARPRTHCRKKLRVAVSTAVPGPAPALAPSTCNNAMAPLQLQQLVTLACNGKLVECHVASGPWLAQSPRGAYTVARTVGGSHVFELSAHIQRLADSVRLMLEADCKEGRPGAEEYRQAFQHLTDPQRLRPLVIASLSAAMASYEQAAAAAQQAAPGPAYVAPALQTLLSSQPAAAEEPAISNMVSPSALAAAAAAEAAPAAAAAAAEAAPAAAAAAAAAGEAVAQASLAGAGNSLAAAATELKLSVLVVWGPQGADVYAHAGALPPRPRPPVKVQVRGSPRTNALAKDSEWVRQRKALEASKPADVDEILLVEPCGSILEGMSSNFYAVQGGTLYTAGEGVLQGTVRRVVLEVAEREGIPVVLQAPRLQDLASWDGAFISSTSRLALPLDELAAPDYSPPLARRWERHGGCELVQRLERLVLARIEAHSEPLE